MKTYVPPLRSVVLGALAAALAGGAAAQTPTDRPPNLKALPASNISLVTDTATGNLLRLSPKCTTRTASGMHTSCIPTSTGSR